MMKKAFVWDPVMRSSAIKYDPCIVKKGEIQCDDCKITLIADRFLGKEFQRDILGKMGKSRGRYPYVIIADGLGCNLRCWFCYAYKFFDKDTAQANRCQISYVTPQRLAEQFGCKLEKLSQFETLIKALEEKQMDEKKRASAHKHLQMKLPLMRIRISGGEPLFSTHDTLLNPTKPNILDASIDYWLTFFEELDIIIGDLKQRRLLHIIDKNDVKNKEWKGELPFPTCIAERHGRLNIRFDTNGILFGNAERTDTFIGGLYDLFRRGKLKNLYIEIDYSFKGATPIEYDWSQRRGLPVDASRISFNYSNDEHPQIPGHLNITQSIAHYYSNDTNFTNGIGITVERGINHNKSHKTYLNCPESLNWQKFSDKTGIEFSVVDNPIEMFNWRNYQPKRAFINHGANITIISDQDTFNLQQHPSMQAFNLFRQTHPNIHFIIYPVKETITLEKRSRKKIPGAFQQTLTSESGAWTLSGNPANWEIALVNTQWGVRASSREVWKLIQPDDTVLMYVTRPVSRLIGYAKVKQIVEENTLLWPDEVQEQDVKYPLRIRLYALNYLPRELWRRGLSPASINIRHGINIISTEQKWKDMVEKLRQKIAS